MHTQKFVSQPHGARLITALIIKNFIDRSRSSWAERKVALRPTKIDLWSMVTCTYVAIKDPVDISTGTGTIIMISWVLSVTAVLVLFLLYKLVILATADGDLTVLSKSMNPAYYKDKVVWVTGASSGSELCLLSMVVWVFLGYVGKKLQL